LYKTERNQLVEKLERTGAIPRRTTQPMYVDHLKRDMQIHKVIAILIEAEIESPSELPDMVKNIRDCRGIAYSYLSVNKEATKPKRES
jgi:hypothetical protein